MSTVSESIATVRSVRKGVPQRTLARNIIEGKESSGLNSVGKAIKSLVGKPFATVYNAIRRFDAKTATPDPVVEDNNSDDDYEPSGIC